MYNVPDLTGEKEEYRRINNIKTIFKTGQIAHFGRPVFKKNLNITLLGTINRVLRENLDWKIEESNKDYEAMSMIRSNYPDFRETLIHSVTMLIPVSDNAQAKINFDYQMLYPLYSEAALYKGEPIEFTPNLLIDLLERLNYLEYIVMPVKSTVSVEDATPILLEPDPYLERSENIIINEKHEMDVPNNVHFIYPVAGTFFKDTLKVRSSGVTLVEGTDYIVFGCDNPKTKMTNHKGGAYNFILILKKIIGSVYIDYHAFGGDVTLYDQREIEKRVLNVINLLNSSQFLTPETIGNTPTFLQLRTRLAKLEEDMRRLCSTGKPSYGDIIRGGMIKKITAPDTDLHWYSIATLYKVDGSPDSVIVSDRIHLRMQTLITKFMFDIMISVDLTNPSNKFNLNVLSNIYPKGFIPLEHYDIDSIIRPQLRIIWNENTVKTSGIILQLGFELKQVNEETIAIEDLSGVESCWKLIPEVTTSSGPEDNIIPLPDGLSVWDYDTNLVDSRQRSSLIPFTDGYLIWAGTYPLNRPDGSWRTFNLSHYLDSHTDIRTFKRLRVDLLEFGNMIFPIYIDFIPGTETPFGICNYQYNGKNAYMDIAIKRDMNYDIVVKFTSNIEADVSSNQLDLRHVVLYT